MLTVTTSGLTEANLSQLLHNDKKVTYLRPFVQQQGERLPDAVQVEISGEARELHRVRLLVQQADAAREEKVAKIKEQISQRTYYVDPVEVAKAIVRGDISRLLGRG